MYTNNNDCKADNGETFQFSYSDGSYGFTAEGEFHPFSSGGTDTSDATAYAKNIEAGYTAYCRGEKITGTAYIAHGIIKYPGSISPLSNTTTYTSTAASIGDYALFAIPDSYANYIVDTYNSSLIKSSAEPLSQARHGSAATNIGDYALFGGGSGINAVDAYDTSLTRSIPTALSVARGYLAATSIGNYALFGGGSNSNVVDAYDTSLTRSTITALTDTSRYMPAATSNPNYALFGGGGSTSTNTSNTVDAYNTSLVKSTPTGLILYVRDLSAASIGDYALFAGGMTYNNGSGNNASYNYINAYSSSLTRSNNAYLSQSSHNKAATSTYNYAIFGGGKYCTTNKENNVTAVVNAFDNSLSRTVATPLSEARYYIGSANIISTYALFAGGCYYNTSSSYAYYNTVDVYIDN